MFLHSCVPNQHSWQMYSMAMTSAKSWQLSYMALTIHWQYSCTALVSKKSLTTIPYGHQASWQKDAMDVSLKNTIDKVTKFYLKQKKSLTKFWCWQSDAPPKKLPHCSIIISSTRGWCQYRIPMALSTAVEQSLLVTELLLQRIASSIQWRRRRWKRTSFKASGL